LAPATRLLLPFRRAMSFRQRNPHTRQHPNPGHNRHRPNHPLPSTPPSPPSLRIPHPLRLWPS
jgi:hypothetical protein